VNVLASARIAVRALRVNKLRSALTMLGIVIGVGAVITMVAVGAGAQARVAEQIQSLGANVIVIWPGTVTMSGVRLGAGAQATLSEDDAWAVQRDIPLVEVVAPYVRGNAQVVYSNLNWATGILGVTPEYFPARDWEVIEGRMLTQEEVDGASKVALIGQTVSRNLFGDEDPLGQVIRIKKVPFTIIGVMDRKGQTTWGQDQDDQILIPISTAKTKVLGGNQAKGRAVGAITIKVREAGLMKAAENEIRELLRQRHKLQTFQEDDFNLRNLAEVLQSQEAASKVLTLLLAAIASVSLLVGGIGIMNIMLVSVRERTKEIGLRKALGAHNLEVLFQFLVEALLIGVIGGGIGVAFGTAAAVATSMMAGWPILLPWGTVFLAVIISAATGVGFGLWPAWQASRLSPIEALRYE
jgi:putative ABC transport system permease protein